ncbi:hypothetical protein AB0945_29350 [Streptomyces sp. NPDC005474]|uniref:hypothetical protein n=1 Tax=Streptomyces sp. NPDC005474 TaxID=3154878 RepID=UPI003453675A
MNAQETTETAMQRTYRLWFKHADDCNQCAYSASPSNGCAVGRELWGLYRLARMGRGTS